ncbi:MAG: D-alanine--D-alanine ligase [Gammaproteobacteria bacterium]|nr:D-alanine--D-alanine ligase [Gammaproteobacteria bacterium]
MLIGLTYDLRGEYLAAGYSELETAEFDRGETIDAIEAALCRLGHRTERIGNVRQLARALVDGKRWDLVFNIAEGLGGFGREAQVPALLDAWNIPYTFSDPLTCALTLHKALAKRVVRDAGVPTPRFAVVETPAEVAAIDLPYPLFAKPLAEGTGKGIDARSKIVDRAVLATMCQSLLQEFQQPVLVEEFLPGREFTVGILGTGTAARSLGVAEIVLNASAEAEVYSYLNKEECESRVEYRLLAEAALLAQCEDVALRAWRALLCRDGGRIDLRCNARGEPEFLEVNPLAGLHPEHSDLPILCTLRGIGYDRLIGDIVASASTRLPSAVAAQRSVSA